MRYSSVSRFCAARMEGNRAVAIWLVVRVWWSASHASRSRSRRGQMPQVDEWVDTGAVGRGHENSLERSRRGFGGSARVDDTKSRRANAARGTMSLHIGGFLAAVAVRWRALTGPGPAMTAQVSSVTASAGGAGTRTR